MPSGYKHLSLFKRQVEVVRLEIGSLLKAELAGSPEFMGMVAGALEAQRKGNALEGARWLLLSLAACEAAGGDWNEAVPAAAAIELFITAGDLFDDIEDRDIPSSDVPHAANVACALLLLSEKAALRLKDGRQAVAVLHAISGAGTRSCAGQYQDIRYEACESVTEQAWMDMTDLRSGSLVECVCRVGAIAGTDDEQQIETYARFGRLLGIAGQISN
ncbi:MAG: polyprenyl synthetase family protein, partial [Dehalococcoidia bacterium]|nr:polyprenyl synthetase family protein [Dehalococcoidia bacterium]